MATNEPLVPSMIFRSRTTKASSNVTEQKACRRSFSLPSSMSLIRTSVITTVVLLFSVAHSIATPNKEQFPAHPSRGASGVLLLRSRGQFAGEAQGLVVVTAQGEYTAAAAAHQLTGRGQLLQPGSHPGYLGLQPFGRLLQAVV